MSKKKGLVAVIVAIIIVALIAGVAGIWFNAFGPTYTGRTAIIYSLDGEGVAIERAADTEAAYAGMRIKGGDTIVTDAESMVTIRVDNDKDILLGKASRMEVTTLEDKSLVLTLVEGEFFFNVAEKLGMGETMSFKIGATSMSIRGTSGGGSANGEEAQFVIITGAGAITTGDSEDVEVYVIPQTKVEFNTNTGYDTATSTVSAWTASEDQSDAMTSFLQSNDDYRNMLNEDGWVINEEGTIEEEPIVEVNPEDKPETFIGWRQNGDGTWEFSQEDFEAGIGPTYYEYPEKPVAASENVFVYDGTEKSVLLFGFNPANMTIECGAATEIGYYTATITPIYHWIDETTDPVYIKWCVIPSENDLGAVIYNGQEQTVIPEGFDLEKVTITGNVAKNVGTYTVTVLPIDGVWDDGSVEPFIFTWEIKPIVVDLALDGKTYSRVYNGTTGWKLQNVTFPAAVSGDNVTVDLVAVTSPTAIKNANTYNNVTISATLRNANGNYELAKNQFVVDIIVNPIFLTINDLPDYEYVYNKQSAFEETYTGSALNQILPGDDVGVIVHFTLSNFNVDEYLNVPVNYELTGAQSANYSFSTTSQSSVKVTIQKAPVTITVADVMLDYGMAVLASDFDSVVEGLVGTDTMTVPYYCDYGTDVSDYEITVDSDIHDTYPNYDITVVPGTLSIYPKTVHLSIPAQTYTYGSTIPDFSNTIVFNGLVGTDTIDASTYVDSAVNAGTYTIVIQVNESDYPNYEIVTHNNTLTITPKAVSIQVSNASKTFGDSDPTSFAATVTGLVGTDTISYTIVRVVGENVGTYDIGATYDSSLYPNYSITMTKGTFTITAKSVVISVSACNKTYGSADPTFAATVTGLVGSDTIDYTLSRETGEDVGTYAITATYVATNYPNYSIEVVTNNLAILAKDITVTVTDYVKTYLDDDPDFSVRITGALPSDTIECVVTRQPGEATGVYTLTPGLKTGKSYPNYNITMVAGSLTIVQRSITFIPEISDASPANSIIWVDNITGLKTGMTSVTYSRHVYDAAGTEMLPSDDAYSLTDGLSYEMRYTVTCTDDNIVIYKQKRSFTMMRGSAQSQSVLLDEDDGGSMIDLLD